jgi:hypothetical protein
MRTAAAFLFLLVAAAPASAQLVPSAPEQIKRAAIDRCSFGEPADVAYCREQANQLHQRERMADFMAGQNEALRRMQADRDRYDLTITVPAITIPRLEFDR